ncbi:hypothetical protein [Rhodanobacter sp. L36]|uniref:hypothetical protein n=1 Tax=Rhodanobacter sp. L36 TaxID=1747221 RepID=UPI00131B30F5|nr:hypothetical protein [Rhodanobacter sp. L36]
MATESVSTRKRQPSAAQRSKHDLWIADDKVLTITVDRKCKHFPPEVEQCDRINEMIQGLARAAKSVIFHVENDTGSDAEFATRPIGDIANAIILLSQLSTAIRTEIGEVQS